MTHYTRAWDAMCCLARFREETSMRKSTLARAVVLALLVGVVSVTGINADSVTQDCWQECETAYNQCMANCQGWRYFFCAPACGDQYTYCVGVCNGSGEL